MTSGEIIMERHKTIEVNILEEDIETIIEMTILEEVEVGLGTDNIQVILAEMIEVAAVGLDQVQELALTETELRCFKCREYDHFAKDCQNFQTKKEPEQIQPIYNLMKKKQH